MDKQVQYLIKLRDHLRDQRRKLIHRWATTSKMMPANLTRLVRIQNELHAVEVAIRDEQATERPPAPKVKAVKQKYQPDDELPPDAGGHA
jgi:hypothetical protein